MASQKLELTPQLKETIRKEFDKYDTDKNGTLDKMELRACLETTLKTKLSDNLFGRYVEASFQKTDKDSNQVIDFDEFCELYRTLYIQPEIPIGVRPQDFGKKAVLEKGDNAKKVQQVTSDDIRNSLTPEELKEAEDAFSKYDTDNSGTIDRDELKNILKDTIGKRMGEAMLNRMLEAQMQLYDKDNSGAIDRDEFLRLYVGLLKKKEPTKGPMVMGFGM